MSTVTHSDGVEARINGQSTDITPFVSRFIWVESMIRGGFFWEIQFTSNVWSDWNSILLGKANPHVEFRLKSLEDGNESTTEWRRAITDSSEMMFRGETLFGKVLGGDRRLALRQKHLTRAWPQRTVSEIAQIIAADYDMTPRVDDTSLRTDWFQTNETDWEFLQRLVYESSNAGGRGDLFLWVDEDILHIHAPVLQDASARRHDMSIVEGRVDNVLLSYFGRQVDRIGGATLKTIGYDFRAKKGLTFTLGSVQAQVHPALAGRVPRAQADGVRVMPVPADSQAEVEANARGRWSRYAPRYFAMRCETRPDLTLQVGSTYEMQASIGENQETPFLGRFLLLEVEHEFVQGSIKTSAVCFRREAAEGEEEPTGQNAENASTRDHYRFGVENVPNTIVIAEVLD